MSDPTQSPTSPPSTSAGPGAGPDRADGFSPADLLPEDTGTLALAGALRSSFTIVKIIMGALVVVFFVSGMKIVGPQEQAVLLRFGKPVGEGAKVLLGSGLHWAFPYPVDEIVRVPIGQVQTISSSVGWYATTPAMEAAGTEPEPGESLNPAIDGYTITADQNIIHVRASLRYHVSDAVRFVFGFKAASNVVENALNNALVFASAHHTADDALIRGLIGFQEMTQARLEQTINQQQLGIAVDQLNLRAIPPRKLKSFFDAVVKSAANMDELLKRAQTYANEVTNYARGQADIRINAGENDRTRQVYTIGEESRRFINLRPGYETNQDFLVRQLQLEALQKVLTNVQEKIILSDRADNKPRELRLQINRELPKPRIIEPPKAEDGH